MVEGDQWQRKKIEQGKGDWGRSWVAEADCNFQ